MAIQEGDRVCVTVGIMEGHLATVLEADLQDDYYTIQIDEYITTHAYTSNGLQLITKDATEINCKFCNRLVENDQWEFCPWCGWRTVKHCDVRQLYTEAIALWGRGSQINMAEEELIELLLELKRLIRNRNDGFTSLAEEIADVEIMCQQLRVMFSFWGDVDTDGKLWPKNSFDNLVRSYTITALYNLTDRIEKYKMKST